MIDDKNLPLKQEFLACYRKLPILKLAAAYVGKSHDTVQRWREKDASFALLVVRARIDWAVEKSQKANPMWLLERIIGEEFADKPQDLSVNVRLEEALSRMARLLPK